MRRVIILLLLVGFNIHTDNKDSNFLANSTNFVMQDFKESLQNCFSSESKEALGFRAMHVLICTLIATDLARGKNRQDFLISGAIFFLGMCYIDFYKNKFFKEKNLFFKKLIYTGLFLLYKAAMPEMNTFADLKRLYSLKGDLSGDFT